MPHKSQATFILPRQMHTGLKAARASPKPGAKRQEAMIERTKFWKQLEQRNWLDDMMKKYDTSNTGNLLINEVAAMLQETSGGEKPTDEEVAFVIRSTHREAKDRRADLTRSEIPTALDTWHEYERQKPKIAAVFDSFDTNKTGKLEADQLKKLLTELNEGIEAPDEEVKWVMDAVDGALDGVDATGGVNRTELCGAISLWYTHIEDLEAQKEDSNKDETTGAAPPPPGKSGCCVVM
mmetsp:Transcript_7938/g.19321  ORF Transcript_7938/g.19321 Transcript_7938/m.19321 type:complete len:237 (-) Transcript_7938:98-808(-)